MGIFGNPANAAMPYLNQIQGTITPYLQPYSQYGQDTLPMLMGQYGNLINNPGQFLNQMGQNFQQSPGYQFQVNQALGAANRASAAGGMAGSPMEQQNIAGTVNQLANQDYYNWLNHAAGMYGMGLQGLQGMGQQGLQAGSELSSDLAQALMSKANLAYAGQANQNQMYGNLFGQGIGFLGNMVAGMAPV